MNFTSVFQVIHEQRAEYRGDWATHTQTISLLVPGVLTVEDRFARPITKPIHWSSAHNYQHKYACLASRVYRAAKLITQKQDYIQELARICQDFLCHDYPDIWITNNINKLDKQHRTQATNREPNSTQPRSINLTRFPLPYIPHLFDNAQEIWNVDGVSALKAHNICLVPLTFSV